MIPLVFALTNSSNVLFGGLALQPASRIVLTGPFILAIAVQGGLRWTLLGFAVIAATFWGYPVLELTITGHQLVLYSVFGNIVHRLIAQLDLQQREVSLANVRLEELALRDAITGFYNRHALEQQFKDHDLLIGLGQVLASWDLDGLKVINDTQGHIEGDRYLQDFSTALRTACGPDDRVYRIGGDEFISLHTDCSDPQSIITKTRGDFPNVSVGWTLMSARDLDALLLETDALMYADKKMRRQNAIGW